MNKRRVALALKTVATASVGTALAVSLSVGCGATSTGAEQNGAGSASAGTPGTTAQAGGAGAPTTTSNGGSDTSSAGSGAAVSGSSGIDSMGGASAGGTNEAGGSGSTTGGTSNTAGSGGAIGSGGSGGGIVTLACPAGNAICTAKTYNDITAAHMVPSWVKTTKLGIGMHFMVATVPAYHNEWFFQHEYCNKAFSDWTAMNFPTTSPLSGGPWGYKDFIPLFTVDKWSQTPAAHAATNAASWAALFKASGATFVNATAEHHDRFAMWDSSGTGNHGQRRHVERHENGAETRRRR